MYGLRGGATPIPSREPAHAPLLFRVLVSTNRLEKYMVAYLAPHLLKVICVPNMAPPEVPGRVVKTAPLVPKNCTEEKKRLSHGTKL